MLPGGREQFAGCEACDRGRAVNMPLDTGAIVDLSARSIASGDPTLRPNLQSGVHVGEALRLIRESHGLSLQEVAEATRVRRVYLEALESLRLDLLPSRPFTIGYIRAYAQSLGLDAEAAVERFKVDEPVLDEPLRNPIGVQETSNPKLRLMVAGAILVLAAIIVWNVAQRAMIAGAPPPPKASDAAAARALAQAGSGPVSLGAPLPAPVESTTPTPYITPGLDRAGPDGKGNMDPPGTVGAVNPDSPPPDTSGLDPVFRVEGKIYGASTQPSMVTLKALRSASLIVRGPDGSVYFARQLDKGEAYRLPQGANLTVDVSAPLAFQVFVSGQSKGFLPAPQIAASRLEG